MEFKHLLIFCLTLVVPFVFFRSVLSLLAKPLSELTTYTREGLKFHHFHYGIMLLVVGILGLFILGLSIFPIILVGLGLGTMLDEFYPSLFVPEPEPTVTEIYRKSFRPTALILLGLVVIVVLVGLLLNKA